MSKKQTTQLQIKSQFIKDISFEAPELPDILTTLSAPPKINVDISTKASPKQNDLYEVELKIKAQALNEENNKTIFLCEIAYASLVELQTEEELIQPILLIEVPHFLFPYVRALVAHLTQEAGLPPLQLTPVDFAFLYQQKIKQQNDK